MAVSPNTDYKTSNLQYRPQGEKGFSSVKLEQANESSVDKALTAIARKVLGEPLPDHLNVTAQASLIQIQQLDSNGAKIGAPVTLKLEGGKWSVTQEGENLKANGTNAANKSANYDTELSNNVQELLRTVRGIYQHTVGQNNNASNNSEAVFAQLDSSSHLNGAALGSPMPISGSNNNNNHNNAAGGDNNLNAELKQLQEANQTKLDEIRKLQEQLKELGKSQTNNNQQLNEIQQLKQKIEQLQLQLQTIDQERQELRSSMEALKPTPSPSIDATLSTLNNAHNNFQNAKNQYQHLLN